MEDTKDKKLLPGITALQEKPIVTVDYEFYAKFLEDSEMNEAQKRELIESLWNIIVQFVDLGFGVHPLQQACEQEFDLSPTSDSIAVKSGQILPKTEFENAVCPPVETQTRRRKT